MKQVGQDPLHTHLLALHLHSDVDRSSGDGAARAVPRTDVVQGGVRAVV